MARWIGTGIGSGPGVTVLANAAPGIAAGTPIGLAGRPPGRGGNPQRLQRKTIRHLRDYLFSYLAFLLST